VNSAPSIRTNPEHWRARAQEARLHAQSVADEAAKAAMLSVAEQYERIAARLMLQRADDLALTQAARVAE